MKLQQWTCSDAQGTFRRWPSVPIHKTPGSLRESGLTGPRETDPSPSTAQVWRHRRSEPAQALPPPLRRHRLMSLRMPRQTGTTVSDPPDWPGAD